MSTQRLKFQQVYRLYQPKIRRYVSRLVGEHEADDLTQEIFLKVSQGLSGFKGRSKLSTWVYRISTNAALDRLRSPAFQQSLSRQSSPLPAPEEAKDAERQNVRPKHTTASAETALIRQEMLACFKSIVDNLPANYRPVILLSMLEDMKNTEIAEILEIPLETVKIRLHRGRARLRKELENHCGFYRDARKNIIWDGRIF